MAERFTVHIHQRSGACTSYYGLTEQEAFGKVESCFKRRVESVSRAEDGREAGASWKQDGRWKWYHEAFLGSRSRPLDFVRGFAN